MTSEIPGLAGYRPSGIDGIGPAIKNARTSILKDLIGHMTDTAILCVGALTLDTIFQLETLPTRPGKFMPLAAVEVAGGMSSSAAASIARLGGAVALWASVGDDAAGERLVSQIAAEGVDCSRVRRVGGARSAFSTILVDRTGERIVVPQYDPTVLAEPGEPFPISAREFSAVMTDVRWPDAAASALARARDAGLPAILDADVGPVAVLERLAALATHIVASEPAAELLTGEAQPRAALQVLAERYRVFVAVTAGADGVYWMEEGGVRHCPAPRVSVVDTLAAGDVFHGAFAFGLVRGWAMERVMELACAAAAIKCSRFGGRLGAPSLAEAEALVASAPA